MLRQRTMRAARRTRQTGKHFAGEKAGQVTDLAGSPPLILEKCFPAPSSGSQAQHVSRCPSRMRTKPLRTRLSEHDVEALTEGGAVFGDVDLLAPLPQAIHQRMVGDLGVVVVAVDTAAGAHERDGFLPRFQDIG